MSSIGPFVDGNIARVKRRCENKNCRCYLKGQKHESYYLMYKVRGVTKAVYIPVDLEDELREWNDNYKRLKEVIAETTRVNKEITRRCVTEKKTKERKKMIADIFFKTVSHFFPKLTKWLNQVVDPRQVKKITYRPSHLLWLGVFCL